MQTWGQVLNYGADVRVKDANGKTALHKAAEQGLSDMVKMLLDAGALPDAADKDRNTALMLAAQAGHAKVVEVLLDVGAEPEVKNNTGKTAGEMAAAGGHQPIAQQIEKDQTSRMPANAIRPPPGANLTDAIREAADGQVIVLGKGEYKGSVLVIGKKIIIRGDPSGKTILSGGDQEMVVYVGEKAHLVMENVKVLPVGNSKLSIAVIDASARIINCEFERTPGTAIHVQASEVEVRSCRFAETAKAQ
jgi:hypothetical protein